MFLTFFDGLTFCQSSHTSTPSTPYRRKYLPSFFLKKWTFFGYCCIRFTRLSSLFTDGRWFEPHSLPLPTDSLTCYCKKVQGFNSKLWTDTNGWRYAYLVTHSYTVVFRVRSSTDCTTTYSISSYFVYATLPRNLRKLFSERAL